MRINFHLKMLIISYCKRHSYLQRFFLSFSGVLVIDLPILYIYTINVIRTPEVVHTNITQVLYFSSVFSYLPACMQINFQCVYLLPVRRNKLYAQLSVTRFYLLSSPIQSAATWLFKSSTVYKLCTIHHTIVLPVHAVAGSHSLYLQFVYSYSHVSVDYKAL